MKYDLAVIGAGTGGLTAAAFAAKFGRKVVLFEKARMGGDCLNVGCVPSKALLAVAKRAHAMRESAAYGIEADSVRIDYEKVRAHVKAAIAAIAPNDSQERFENLGVRVIRSEARFRDAQTVEAAGETFTARRFVIATGSRPFVPDIPGLADVPYLTNETLFDLEELPERLIIIGAGPIGIEMAQAFCRLGSQVTVIEAGVPLQREDKELASIIVSQLKVDGVKLLARTSISSVAKNGDEIAVATSEGERITGTHLLAAAGRIANTEGLNLEAAGIATTRDGITVDASLRTSNARVFAVGDVAGQGQYTHLANHQAILAASHALFGWPLQKTVPIPRVLFTDPELAQIGLIEDEARKLHGDAFKVVRFPFKDNDRAIAEGQTQGLVKVVVGRGGRILGAGIAGAGAGDLIHPWALAMSNNMPIKSFLRTVLPYPTRGEASKRAAINCFSYFATNIWIRRVLGLIGKMG